MSRPHTVLVEKIVHEITPLHNFIKDLTKNYTDALKALGEQPAVKKNIKQRLDHTIFKIKLFELLYEFDTQNIEEFALYILNEFSEDEDLFRLELPFEAPSNIKEYIKNILYCAQFPGLLMLAAMGQHIHIQVIFY